MKILWLASWYPNPANLFDGDFIQRHAKALALYVPVTVFYVSQAAESNQVKENDIRIKDGVEERIISFGFKQTGFSFWDKFIYNWKYYTTYKRAIGEFFKKEGRPDIIHVHVPMKAGMIARWIKKRYAIPYIVTEHSTHYKMGTQDDFFNKNIVHRNNVAKIFRRAELVTNVSYSLAQKIKDIFLLHKTRVIHNTVDTSLFNYNPGHHSKFRFIHVSTLAEHQKNMTGILSAVKKLTEEGTDFELVIVGPSGDELKQKVAALSLEKIVIFTGEIFYEEVALQMQDASALILFSRYENFPCVIIEAFCCGLPVIATDVGGIKEAVNENNGLLVSSENEDELMLAMAKMIREYQNFDRRQIADKASRQFGYPAIGKQFYDLYKEILYGK
jgi:glycosyltransferase involved in cell wall biosynthesis